MFFVTTYISPTYCNKSECRVSMSSMITSSRLKLPAGGKRVNLYNNPRGALCDTACSGTAMLWEIVSPTENRGRIKNRFYFCSWTFLLESLLSFSRPMKLYSWADSTKGSQEESQASNNERWLQPAEKKVIFTSSKNSNDWIGQAQVWAHGPYLRSAMQFTCSQLTPTTCPIWIPQAWVL